MKEVGERRNKEEGKRERRKGKGGRREQKEIKGKGER